MEDQNFNWFLETKLFIRFFIEAFLLLVLIQIISDKINNNSINYYREARMAIVIAIILYTAKYINNEMQQNISQGMHYAISGVFIAKYVV